MTLLQHQQLFAKLVPQLLLEAHRLGYAVTLGECWRSPEEAKRLDGTGAGIKASLHCDRLAIDVNLYLDGRWLTRSEEYAVVGSYWKSLHPLCRWGGDFTTRPDGNHFSITQGGRR
jgi:hypothetical protein